MQAEQTLVLMVWVEPHIKVWGGVGRGDTFCHTKSKVDIMAISLFQSHNSYTDTEQGQKLEMSYMQVDWILVYMVWMESHIEVWGVV